MSPADTNSGFFCDLEALNPIERQRRRELAEGVGRAVRKRVELPNGYALTLDAGKVAAAAMNEWIMLEKRCCPFLNFELRAGSAEQELTLELTGADGIKEFLRAEFSR